MCCMHNENQEACEDAEGCVFKTHEGGPHDGKTKCYKEGMGDPFEKDVDKEVPGDKPEGGKGKGKKGGKGKGKGEGKGKGKGEDPALGAEACNAEAKCEFNDEKSLCLKKKKEKGGKKNKGDKPR